MSFDYDVAIVGGGPIGSTLAYKIAKEGYKVAILDKKKEIGIPLQCAGIVSKKLMDVNEIPDNLILNSVKGAYLHSSNNTLKVEKNHTEAFIIDRIAYDKFLAERAVNNGVKFFNQYKVTYIDSDNGIIRCQNNMEVSAKIIVGADGSKSFVSSLINEKFNYFNASQYLVEINTSSRDNMINTNAVEFVDLFAISKILPGFLWCIPTSDSSFRVGLFSNNSYKDQKEILNSFLDNDERFKESSIIEKYHGKIPIFDKNKKIIKDRILLIGDAASQLKPTTGGGLIIGFDTTNLAKDAIIKSLDNDNINFLKDYEQNFKKKYAKELNYQIRVQKTLENLSDNDLDFMFTKLKEKNAEEIISKYGDMDKQSILVKEFIKRGLIFSIIPKVFFRKLISIWSL
ncbi:dehydrogenase [Methanobrevibacter arboriphilus]|jgi:geranylgeranyl reductase family protein|uniref:Dehydrogenase n=1 Tax=Methanobrevibacter arboriphilus TaxID=39441 RepID=A0ACA8R3C2_METAZ|nr:NAD(P)/FAD-dependent oxidoreductase [Methanobrevibacter arboriphilus]MCC7561663.1 NAD(P)/FAD-dependent oxidoreductase [Methanobrevibacter arboriphilus]BBL61335.1 dehydrogenase [Methanobrevibacter arboriphilus]GLI11331.1 dehydrogenase [Methanobrevibacter arboriphilus]